MRPEEFVRELFSMLDSGRSTESSFSFPWPRLRESPWSPRKSLGCVWCIRLRARYSNRQAEEEGPKCLEPNWTKSKNSYSHFDTVPFVRSFILVSVYTCTRRAVMSKPSNQVELGPLWGKRPERKTRCRRHSSTACNFDQQQHPLEMLAHNPMGMNQWFQPSHSKRDPFPCGNSHTHKLFVVVVSVSLRRFLSSLVGEGTLKCVWVHAWTRGVLSACMHGCCFLASTVVACLFLTRPDHRDSIVYVLLSRRFLLL